MHGQSLEHTSQSISSSRAEAASRGTRSTFLQRMIGDTSESRRLNSCPERTRLRRPGLRIKAAVRAHGDGATRRRQQVAAGVGPVGRLVEPLPAEMARQSQHNRFRLLVSKFTLHGNQCVALSGACTLSAPTWLLLQTLPKNGSSPLGDLHW
jgi:hypothetical protein